MPHQGLDNQAPIDRWREDLLHLRPLGAHAHKIDDIFCHRIERRVKKDATVRWEGNVFEVDYERCGQTVQLVIDPHAHRALRIESMQGEDYGPVTPQDKEANCHRKRQRPHHAEQGVKQTKHAVENDYEQYTDLYNLPSLPPENEEK